MIDKTIAHYRVTAKLGAGGMGEVYRARDGRLARDVAIKVLPQAFASDAARMARFAREAQLLASLNHPHIAAIYGLEEAGTHRALVMELVEGPTLAERIAQGPLPLDEALPLARQIAEALEYAHDRGIIHRDLKPANIKVTAEGNAKILDFGLAKALEGDPAGQDISASPTLTFAATQAGVILGTAAYMSPEQAKGKAADRRADVWAFGVVLYEMLVGQPLFHGETASETLAGVIKEEPDWSRLPAGLPASIRKLVIRCLTKDPRQRLQAIGEARIAVEQYLANPSAESAPATAATPAVPARRALLPWAVAAGMAIVAAVALWGWLRGQPPAARDVKRFAVQLPQNQVMFGVNGSFAISPDGRYLAYNASRINASGWQLFLRSMDQIQAEPLGNEDGESAFFSPDGQWVGYFSGGKMKKISVHGGAPVTLCDATLPRGATWGPDDTIIFAPAANTGLWRVSGAGGTPQPLTQLDANNRAGSHRWPYLLPGGEAVLFTTMEANNPETARIAALSLRTGKWKIVIDAGSSPHYLPSGHIVFVRNSTLFAVPFDLRRLEVTGDPAPVLENIAWDNVGVYFFSTSADGTLVYVPGTPQRTDENQLVWVDRKGTEKAIAAPSRAYTWPRLSPNGRQVAFRVADPNIDIWVYQFSSGALPRLTFQPGEDETSVWTPDGKRIAYSASLVGKPRTIYIKNADGSGPDEVLFEGGIHTHVSSFSPDARWLLFTDYDPATKGDIYMLPLQGDRKPQVFLKTPFNECDPKFSPDGRWVVYTSDESGQNEVYVQAFPGPGGKWQVSAGGGHSPVWAHSGREIFYRNAAKLMAVPVATQPAFVPSAPQPLFEGTYLDNPRREANYDVSPDGQRFLMLKGSISGSGPMQYITVLNWSEEVKRRVPTTR